MKKLYMKKLVMLFALVLTLTSAFGQETWYVKNSGNWTDYNNWTLDPSGNDYINPDSDYPKTGDAVVIGPGLEMNVMADGQINVQSLILNGTLNLGTTINQRMAEFKGTGRLVLDAFNLPVVSGSAPFFTAAVDGGTLVFEGGGDITLNANHTFYNVELNRSASTSNVILGANLTLNGDLNIRQGTFQIGNSTTSRTMTLKGDLLVENGGRLITDKVFYTERSWGITWRLTARHDASLSGNVINNGTIDLTANNVPVYRATDTNILGNPTENYQLNYTTLTIKGASNTSLTANGTTNLHRLIIDKEGNDKGYRFTVNPSRKEYFRLFGQNNNGIADKALYIKSGTLELTGATYIHSLTEGDEDFYIPKAGGLWINGSAVEVNSTAVTDNADGFTAVGVNTSTNSGNQSFSVKGLFRISNGKLNTQSHGFVVWEGNDADAMVLIEGGEVQSPGFRSASNETGKLTYHQTGGKVVLRGEVGSDLRGKTEATFDIKGSNNVFIMTGGEIEIQDPVTERNWLNWPTVYRALRIESGEGNYSVSGGSVRIERSSGSDNATFPIQSTAPFYNLSIGGGQTQKQTNVQLSSAIRVLNDLTIGAQGYLDAVNSSRSISVGRHFTLNSGGAFNSRANVFTFDGSQSSVVTNATGSALVFGDLYVAKEVRFTGNYTLSFAGDGAVEIGKGLHLQRGDFRIEENRTIALKGNANLFHGSVLGAGRLNLNGSSTQTLFSDQGKAQSFGSLLINTNVQLSSPARASWMEFGGNRVVDINKHNLELTNPNVYGATGWAANKQIRTSGLSSDGGLTLPVNSVQFFPLGIEGGTMAYARITGAESTARLGKVTVVPVNGRHPGAVSAASGLVDFYFKTDLEFEVAQYFGFQFYFPKTWNPNYPGLVLNNGTWTEQDITKSPSTSTLVDFNNTKSLQGPTDFAVGHKNAVKNPRVLESRNGGGEWNEPGSWTDKGTGNVANSAPTSTDIVYIIEDHEINIPDDSNPSAGQVIFKPSDDSQTPKLVIGTGNSPAEFKWTNIQGQTYDYVYTSGSSFGEVSGRGHIQVNGTTLPSANYTAFLRQEGAIMEYASATAFTLPVNSSVTFTGTNGPSNGPTVLSTFNEYPTLRISGGGTKTGADIDLVIHEDLQVNSDFVLSGEDNGNIRVLRDVAVNAANLLLPEARNRAFKVEGNVLVSGGGEWGISGNGNNGILHQVNLEGDLTLQHGRVKFNKTAKADVYFSGVEASTFSADEEAAASFYRPHINKPEHTKALFNGAFTLTESVQGLVLKSGIAHLNSLGINVLLNSGSGDFIIPAEASLLISNGAIVRTNGTNRGLVLHGKLQVGQGGIANLNGGTNNYLEYSASGKSTIVVEGNGELYIGSQLRRSTETEAGILHFAQLGADSKVVVGDKDSGTPTRAMFEILNEGSTFRQAAGAVLTIKNQKGGSENYDLIFDPSTSTFGKGSAIEDR